MQDQGKRLHYRIAGARIEFTSAINTAHRKLRMGLGRWLLRSRLRNVLTIPVIYGMIAPLALLDLSITLYQAICFPLYGIGKVRRRDYIVLDQHHLAYLNAIEKLHCTYCSYSNGLIAYAREIAARTEQYWCPIRHARQVPDTHSRYARFLDYGDPTDFQARAEILRHELIAEKDSAPTIPARIESSPPVGRSLP
jgi:hypothetical protein